MNVTASVGISIYRDELTKPEDIMREADLALYEAKDSGRDKYVFHSEALDLAVRERVTMVEELRAALDRGEFEVYYQPQVELPSRQIVGVEALLRWNHPSRGLLTPGHFIAIAEKIRDDRPDRAMGACRGPTAVADLEQRRDRSTDHRRQPVRGSTDLAVRLPARSSCRG